MYLITNGQIVTENGILDDFEMLIEEDRIKQIAKKGEIQYPKDIKIINANKGYVTPGFIDIHADYIENVAAPRPTSLMDLNLSLRETEKVLLTHGITTMYHSLSFYKADEFSTNPVRSPENVEKFIDLIHKTHTRKHLIRHRFHARFEIDYFEAVENLKTYINEGKVHLVSFMDHTPGQGQYRNLQIFRKTLKAYKKLTDDEIDEVIKKSREKEKLTLENIKEIADIALEKGIAIASHDDDSEEKLELVKSFGTKISEFPITLDIAQKAKDMGLYTVAGAPNVLLGGSHSGNLSAAEAIEHGTIDILCSDYYPPAILHSIFTLHEKYHHDLAEIFKMATINPAKAVNMDHIIGSIEENKKADIIIIERLDDDFPVITSVLVDGKIISTTNYRI